MLLCYVYMYAFRFIAFIIKVSQRDYIYFLHNCLIQDFIYIHSTYRVCVTAK